MRRALARFALAVLACLAVCGVVGCSAGGGASGETWTVCLYVCGSDLETKHARATQTLDELCGADIPANVTVVVQTGGARMWRNDDVRAGEQQRFVIHDGALQEIDAQTARSMGAELTLADFLEFCAVEYPADHAAVILWDHGGGPTRGVCFDETAGNDALTLSELGRAFATGRTARGGALYDIIGFDACLMGSLEVATQLADDGRCLVASEEIEPGAGWDYASLPGLLASAGGDALAAGAGVCDAYMAKYERGGNAAGATLSVVDLLRAGAVEEALNAAMTELAQLPTGEDALLVTVNSVRAAESFGGATDAEGRTNLVDLHGMAHALASGSSKHAEVFKPLDEAVEDAVAYSVAGAAVADAAGLSIYYPLSYDKSALAAYVETTSLESYAAALQRFFAEGPADVRFADAGSINAAGELSMTLVPESSNQVYDLYVQTRGVSGDFEQTDIEVGDDWDAGTFVTDIGEERWCMALDGVVLDAHRVEVGYDDDYIVYAAPISLNGVETNLRFAWLYDDHESTYGRYEILGTWNGVDRVTGLSDRSLAPLAPGDAVGVLSSQTGRVRNEITVGDDTGIEDAPLPPGTYETRFVVLDVYGAEHPAAAVFWESSKK